jgi:hypothetical protein
VYRCHKSSSSSITTFGDERNPVLDTSLLNNLRANKSILI